MFKFDFNLAEEEVDENPLSQVISTDNQPMQEVKSVIDLVSTGDKFAEHHLLELVRVLQALTGRTVDRIRLDKRSPGHYQLLASPRVFRLWLTRSLHPFQKRLI